MKKVIAFDLDDTITITKSPVDDKMAVLLLKLLDIFQVCVISGGKFEQFYQQLISRLNAKPEQLVRLHIMPTCGTSYYRYSLHEQDWVKIYAEDFSKAEKVKIITQLSKAAKALGYWEAKPYGEIIEDRGSQITFSALGQEAPPEEKYKWDLDGVKKYAIRDKAAVKLPEFEVRVGGSTSVDITRLGIDKGYGMRKLMEVLKINKREILFIGDRLEEGGNDYPVKALGIDTLAVTNWQETAIVVESIIKVY